MNAPGGVPLRRDGDAGTLSWRRDGDAVVLPVYVQPGARRAGVVGIHGDALKVAVSAAPEKGKANKAVEKLLAGALGVRPAAVTVIRGHAARRKDVRILGADPARLRALLGE